MPRPTLFIGSSSESLSIAEQIQVFLDSVANVRIWDANTFYPGEHPLEALRREVARCDYALLVVAPDDHVVKRDQPGYTARDNVLFELGMFMGALGPRRSFYMTITDLRGDEPRIVNIPSDLAGITRLGLDLTSDNETFESALRKEAIKIKNAIEREEKNITLNLLPSTSLAIGYFNNFVLQVCRKLLDTADFRVGDLAFDLTTDAFDFQIVLPDRGADASHEGYRRFTRHRKLHEVQLQGDGKSRNFPFFVDTVVRDGRVQLYDYPTTLRAAREAIQLALPATAGLDDIEALERREIANFERTLRRLLARPDAADFRDNVKIVHVGELATGA